MIMLGQADIEDAYGVNACGVNACGVDAWWSGCIWNGWKWVWMQIDVARILAAPPQSLRCGATSVCISRGFGHYDFPYDYSCIY
jgi:hypothetical protein